MATLYVIATPIGNLEDLSPRAVRILGTVGALACEDTRVTRVLLTRHGIARPAKLLAYHEHNEERAGARLAQLLDAGVTVGLCSNAGYPGISDPGYRVIHDAIERGHRVEVIPGAGAIEPALLCAGLPAASFTFKGFAPRRRSARRAFLASEREAIHTLVLFESPRRTAELLADALAVLGDRRAAVCVELTKKFEAVHRGWLSELATDFAARTIRGEVTVVIAGNHPKFTRAAPESGARLAGGAAPESGVPPTSGARPAGDPRRSADRDQEDAR